MRRVMLIFHRGSDGMGYLGGVVILFLLSAGCSLLPVRRQHVVSLSFVPDHREEYAVDAVDSAAVFRMDGLVVEARYLSRQRLDAEYAKESSGRVNLNPFTYGTRIDNDLGYAPDRFTVFEIEVNNVGRPKVAFDPGQAVLETDRGDRLRPWGIRKGEAAQTFEEYYRAQRNSGGNDQEWYRQRMAIVERDLCRAGPLLFKGQRQQCKLIFDLLHEEVRQVRLQLGGLVIGFDANGLPAGKVEVEFPFAIDIRVEDLR